MDVKLYGHLIEIARSRGKIEYGQTGRHFRPLATLLDEINEHEHAEGRPLLSVLVVNGETHQPGAGFWKCATALGRYRSGGSRLAFLRNETKAVWDMWAE